MNDRWKRSSLVSFLVLLVLGAALFIVACGGGHSSQTTTPPNPNPVPSIQSISPTFVPAGTSSQSVTITGSGFLSSSTVTFNGASRSATFVNSGKLTVTLGASDLAKVGNFPIVVTNPAPGGGASSNADFSVWATVVESSTGLIFSTPPFNTPNQISIDTSTPGRTFVVFALQNASGTDVGEFALTIFSNPSGQNLQQWFEQNIDSNDILLNGGAYEQETLLNSNHAIVSVGPIPATYFNVGSGPPLDSAYALASTGQVISIRQAPANDLANYGYTSPQSLLQLKLRILGTAHF